VAVLEFAFMGRWLVELQMWVGKAVKSATGSQSLMMYATFLLAGLGIVFVPTTLLGAAFPVALRLAVGTEHVGRDVGAVVATNMVGGIIGTLVTGFVLVPHLGLMRTLGVLATAAVAVG
jgi:spermidine synthase